DTLTAVRTRQSIRSFTAEPIAIAGEMLDTILCAGMYAPSAKNKRPCHFIVVRERQIFTGLSRSNPNAAMLETAACAIIVCGDKNREGMKEFLYADCAAAGRRQLCRICGQGSGTSGMGEAAGSG
ncbi:MAG: nitroreductase family protein, partial [Eisenbergiella massiliensis]|uniref:nitroreductase family protein n=2 Tax=Eisenbergiella TaxID=1432051 RepID=UPI0023F263EF